MRVAIAAANVSLRPGRVFFFSSRRRHTRYWRDWSSDVCSSDLDIGAIQGGEESQALDVIHMEVGQQHVHAPRSEEHTSELQSRQYLVCRLLLEKKKKKTTTKL